MNLLPTISTRMFDEGRTHRMIIELNDSSIWQHISLMDMLKSETRVSKILNMSETIKVYSILHPPPSPAFHPIEHSIRKLITAANLRHHRKTASSILQIDGRSNRATAHPHRNRFRGGGGFGTCAIIYCLFVFTMSDPPQSAWFMAMLCGSNFGCVPQIKTAAAYAQLCGRSTRALGDRERARATQTVCMFANSGRFGGAIVYL